ncbi:MAG: response regulator [Pseudomonadota bacterium]
MRKQDYVLFILIAIVPVVFLSYLFYNSVIGNSRQNMMNHINYEINSNLKEVANYIDFRKKNLVHLSTLKDFSIATYYERYEGIERLFNSYINNDREIYGLLFFNLEDKLLAFNTFDNAGKYINDPKNYWQVIYNKINFYNDFLGSLPDSDNTRKIVVYSKVYNEFEDVLGKVVVIYHNNYLGTFFRNTYKKLKNIHKLDSDYYLTLKSRHREDLILVSGNLKDDIKEKKFIKNKKLYNYFQKDASIEDGLSLLTSFRILNKQLFYKNFQLEVIFILVFALSIGIIIILSMVLIKKSFRPTKLVLSKLEELSHGDYSKLSSEKDPYTKYYVDIANSLIDRIESLRKIQDKNSKLAAIGQTAALLAHDIRKPFSNLKSFLDMFETYKHNKNALEAAKKSVQTSIAHVERMVGDIIDFSKSTHLDQSDEQLSSIIDLALKEIASGFSDLDISFCYDINHTLKPFVDKDRMIRVFSNILSNAIEAITIIGKRSYGTVWIKSTDLLIDDKKYIEIIIGNDGPNILDDDLEKLFDSFYTKGKKRGTGLGLASAYSIIKKHGGSLMARNTEDGFGVEFVIIVSGSQYLDKGKIDILPGKLKEIVFVEEQAEDRFNKPNLALLNTTSNFHKLILIEDEALYRASVRNLISSDEILNKSIVLYEANNVEDSITLIKKENIKIAIVDIDLKQNMNGYDFLREVKQQNLKVLSLVHSNRYLKDDMKKAYELGACAYMNKPLTLNGLLNFMEIALKKQKQSYGELEKNRFKANNAKSLVCFIVDDSVISRKYFKSMIQNILMDHEFMVFEFSDPQEALDAFGKLKPQLVFTDQYFENNLNFLGTDFIKSIRMQSKETKIYLYSNTSDDILKDMSKDYDVNATIIPDISFEDLKTIVFRDLHVDKMENKLSGIDIDEYIPKLFHDINKPISNTFMIFNSCKSVLNNESQEKIIEMLTRHKEEIKKVIHENKKKIYQGKELLSRYPGLDVDAIIMHYNSQFDFIQNYIEKDLSETFFNVQERDKILLSLQEINKNNNRLAKDVISVVLN